MNSWVRALFFVAVAAGLFSLPALNVQGRAAIGAPDSEVWHEIWTNWAVAKAVTDPAISLDSFPLLVDPQARDLRARLPRLLWHVLLTPFTLRWGPVAASNYGLIVALLLNSLFGYLFLRRAAAHGEAAIAAALAFGVGALVLNNTTTSGPAAAAVFPVPLALWAVWRAREKPGIGAAVVLAATLGVAWLWDPTHGLGASVMALAFVFARRDEGLYRARMAVLAAVLGGIVIGGLVWSAGPFPPLATVTRSVWHLPVLPDVRTFPFFLTAGALAGLALPATRRAVWRWLAAAALLWFAGLDAAAQITLAVATARVLAKLYSRLDMERMGRIAAGAALVLALTQSFFRLPLPAQAAAAPEAYLTLREEGDGAVLEMPADDSTAAPMRYRFYQTTHGRPVATGHAWSDEPGGYSPALVAAAPGLGPIGRHAFFADDLESVDGARLRADLHALGIRFAALHLYDVPPNLRNPYWLWCLQTFGVPLQQTGQFYLFAVR